MQSHEGFTVKDIVNRLDREGFLFAAKDKDVAVYSAMRRLQDRGSLKVVEEGGPGKPAKWAFYLGQRT